VWEAAAVAAHHHVDNLTVILDYNRVQLLGTLDEILDLAPIADKWRAFNWSVQEIDGHDMAAILAALDAATEVRGKPSIIIAHTTKGKGVSFMKGKSAWHGRVPDWEELELALSELECGRPA
jgi:transketolase